MTPSTLNVDNYAPVFTRLSMTGATLQACKGNAQRVYVGFGTNLGSGARISFQETIAASAGILLPNQGGMCEFWWNRHGPICCAPIWITGNGGTTVDVLELILLPQRPQ